MRRGEQPATSLSVGVVHTWMSRSKLASRACGDSPAFAVTWLLKRTNADAYFTAVELAHGGKAWVLITTQALAR